MTSPPLSTAWVPLWPLAPSPAPVVNGKWLKGEGGAMVWADPAGLNTSATIPGANTDLALPSPDAPINTIRLNGVSAGAVLRGLGTPTAFGARVEVQNWNGFPSFVIQHGGVPGAGMSPISIDGGINTVCLPGHTAHFTYIGAQWQLTGIISTQAPSDPLLSEFERTTPQAPSGTFTWQTVTKDEIASGYTPGVGDSFVNLTQPGRYTIQGIIKYGGGSGSGGASVTFRLTPDGGTFVELFKIGNPDIAGYGLPFVYDFVTTSFQAINIQTFSYTTGTAHNFSGKMAVRKHPWK